MATHFTQDFQNLKQSFSGFHDIDSNMNIITNFPLQSFQNPGRYSLENLPIPGPEFPGNFVETFPGGFIHEIRDVVLPIEPVNSAENDFHNGKKRKSVETPESSWANSSPPPSSGNLIRRENSSGKGKKVMKNSEIGDKKEEGVVHVRARRGQATDSHSLAERVRRGKINERLKCLQSIVPGCYKTMGMAVMLDEIINYVQSLQNQVEFLSMKLSAASTFQDFNFETDQFMQAMQRAKAYEAMKMEKIASEGCEGAVVSNQVCPLFDMNFGGYPSLPFNK